VSGAVALVRMVKGIILASCSEQTIFGPSYDDLQGGNLSIRQQHINGFSLVHLRFNLHADIYSSN